MKNLKIDYRTKARSGSGDGWRDVYADTHFDMGNSEIAAFITEAAESDSWVRVPDWMCLDSLTTQNFIVFVRKAS